MNSQLDSIFTNLEEEAGWTRNDLEVLSRVAWYLDQMRFNDVPRDLFIRVQGGDSRQRPWDVEVYAETEAVHECHRDDCDGHRPAVTGVYECPFVLAPIQ